MVDERYPEAAREAYELIRAESAEASREQVESQDSFVPAGPVTATRRRAKRKGKALTHIVFLVTADVTPQAAPLVDHLWEERHPNSGKGMVLTNADDPGDGTGFRVLLDYMAKGANATDAKRVIERAAAKVGVTVADLTIETHFRETLEEDLTGLDL